MNPRSGYSLGELVACMSVATVLLALAMGAVHRTMRLESAFQDSADLHRVSLRLSRQFRHDVHRAESAELSAIDEEVATLELSIPGESKFVYTIDGARVLRTQNNGDQDSFQVFDFPAGFQPRFVEAESNLLELEVSNPAVRIDARPKTVLHVRAALGRLQRLSKIEESVP